MAVGRKHATAIYFPYPGSTVKESEKQQHTCLHYASAFFCGLQMLFGALLTRSSRRLCSLKRHCNSWPWLGWAWLCVSVVVLLGVASWVFSPDSLWCWQDPLRSCQREEHWRRIGTRHLSAGTRRGLRLCPLRLQLEGETPEGRRGGESYGPQDVFVIFLICVVHLAYYPIERLGEFDF